MCVDFDASTAPGSRRMAALRGVVIFHQGDAACAIYKVEHGCVRLQVEDPDGSRQVIAFVFSGQTICAGFERHWATAHALTDTVLLRIPHNSLWSLIAGGSTGAAQLLFSTDELLNELGLHLNRLSRHDACERMTWFLDWVAKRGDAGRARAFDLPMSRQDMADFLGIAPETVSRLLHRLLESGKLRRVGRRRYMFERFNGGGRQAAQEGLELGAA